jgi:hypothetical protein
MPLTGQALPYGLAMFDVGLFELLILVALVALAVWLLVRRNRG